MVKALRACTLLVLTLACWAAKVDAVDNHRVKRSDDPTPLESVVMQLSSELTQLKAQVTALQNKEDTLHRRIAFLAQLANNVNQSIPRQAAFKFDRVLLNDGSGYDATLGVFTAPQGGVYVLAVQVFTFAAENPLVDIRVNGNIILTRMSLDTRNLLQTSDSVSTAVVAKLNAGDRVWVQSEGDGVYWGTIHTFFSGALLYTV